MIKSDNLFQFLGIHDVAKQQQMEDAFYSYARSLIKSMAKIVSERSTSSSKILGRKPAPKIASLQISQSKIKFNLNEVAAPPSGLSEEQKVKHVADYISKAIISHLIDQNYSFENESEREFQRVPFVNSPHFRFEKSYQDLSMQMEEIKEAYNESFKSSQQTQSRVGST